MSRKKTSSILFIIVVFSLAINSLFYIISDFYPLLSDTARQACGIKNLIENKTLNSENFYLNFAGIDGQLCLTGKTYVLIRVFASFFAFLTPKISPWLSLYLFYLILLALIPFLVFLITKKIFNDNKTALVSSFFGAFAPFLARSALVHPQNLVGFVLILLFALFFVQYHLTKKKINLFVIFAILAVFPFFHHLSFGVLVLSLTAYFLWVTKKKKLILYLGGAMAVFIIVHFFISKLPAEFVLSILNNGLEGGAFWESSIKKPFWEIPSYLGYLLFAFGILGLMYYSSSDPDGHRGSREVPSKLFVSLFLAPLIFSQLYLIGFNFFSFRIIAFAGLPLIIFSGIGFFYLKDFFIKFGIKKLFFSFSILILLGTAGHYFAYLVSIYKARNIYYIPKSDFIAAVKWLNDHSDKKTVIFTTVERRNRQTASLTYLYKGNVIYFPSVYFANPKNLKYRDEAARSRFDPDYFKTEPKHFLGKILLPLDYFKKAREKSYQNAQERFKKLKKLNNFILYPEMLKTNNYEGHRISYVILKKDGWADKIYHGHASSKAYPERSRRVEGSKYKVVYENKEWRVYDIGYLKH